MIEVRENVLPDHIRRGALAAFPSPDWEWWHKYANGKLATVDPLRIPTGCLFALQELARSITPLAGFWDLDCYGAGLHMMPAGTSLGRHLDAEHHPQRPWRRVASLVYFPESIRGGCLTINGDRSIVPCENTAVMFSANQWHEVTKAMADRRTLSLFAWEVDHSPKARTSALFESYAP